MKPDFDNPHLFSFDDSFASLLYLGKINKRSYKRAKASFEEARAFCREYIRPMALAMDLKIQKDPKALAWEMVEIAVKHRRLSAMLPKFMGGMGGSIWATNPIMEEQGSVDPGFSGLMGGHGLGLVALMLTFNFKMLDWVAQQIVKNENEGKPFLIDCAITEPTAGTDVEEEELLPHARLICEARRTNGGVVLNGRKCFISTGHAAVYHVVIIPFNRRDPLGSFGVFLVPGDTPGFSLGRIEEKMGQKAGPASELIFEDCFIPTDMVLADPEQVPAGAPQRLLEGVLGITRIAVGAWATGIARGAFEKALAFAKTYRWKGKTVIQHQWAQEAITDMLMNVYMARSVYMEATHALLSAKSSGLRGDIPWFMETDLFAKIYNSERMRKLRYSPWVRKLVIKGFVNAPKEESQRIQFYASLAKVVGSDIGMDNCHRAIELMGEVGVRHDVGVEKLFRDAKLCQIFEGTNQLNRLNMFKHFLARDIPGVEVF